MDPAPVNNFPQLTR